MKSKKAIEELTAKAKNVHFPVSNFVFHDFQVRLKQLVEENFGYRAKRDLVYDDDAQDFSWEEDETAGVLGSDQEGQNAIVHIRRRFIIDPKRPLLDEFSRVETEREEFEAQVRTARKAILTVGGQIL